MTKRSVTLVMSCVVLVYLVLQLAGLRHMGLTDDDDYYIPAGIAYAEWLGKAVTFRDGAFSRESVDAAFQLNHEHPPLAKYVFGICHFLFQGLLGPTDSARVGTVLFSTLISFLLMLLAVRHLGPRRGLFAGSAAVMFLLLLPRFYFHSHAATLDVPVAATYLLAAAFALFGERSWRFAIASGIAFGLASATKLNGPFLLLPYLFFLLLVRRRDPLLTDSKKQDSQEDEGRTERASTWRLPSVPLAFISMVVLGPLVFFASWPWMWFETVKRVGNYVGFHLNHYPIFFLYFGRVYSKDPHAPWHAPFVMAATTTPVVISCLAIFGVLLATRLMVLRLRFVHGPDDDRRREGDLILYAVLHAFFAIAIVAFSGGPKYGGEKLFAPFFPFWCLLAGYGALRLLELSRDALGRKWPAYAVLSLSLASVVGLFAKSSFGALALSTYNGLVGGPRGATALGFERQYYDVALRHLVAHLNEHAPPNLTIHFLPNNWEYVRTYRWYHRGKELRSDIRVVDQEGQAEWIVLTHERRFSRYGGDLMRLRQQKLIYEQLFDGVPLFSILEVRGP